MTNSLLRILMAMYLAVWSPAVCCCGIKTAIGRVTGVQTASYGEKAAMPAVVEADSRGCCTHNAANGNANDNNDAAASCREVMATAPSSSNNQPPPCRCHETVDSKVRLDTGAKVTLPALAKSDTLTAMAPVVIVEALEPSMTRRIELRDHHSHAPPLPRTTLLAQRCLLLI